MKRNIVGLLSVALLAACSSKEEATTPWFGALPVAAQHSGQVLASQRPSAGSIAGMADTGQLMRYQKAAPAIRTRGYTLYPVSLSERHAIAAVVGGELALTAPDGTPISVRYERHTESPDGDWTWIGRVEGGDVGREAIITFGDQAVFGSIPQPDGSSLNLTTRGGQVYAMQVNPGVYRPATPHSGTDALTAPAGRALSAADRAFVTSASEAAKRQASSTQVASASTNSANTIDLAVGYTNGFAAAMGGQSAARTRIAYLVSVANQALTNSKVSGALRLVSTTQVTYPDNTDNGDALQALTGRDESGASVTVPVALQPLLAARETYGADLVTLVRAFDKPTNNGCGIAWLNGAGGVNIVPSLDDDYGFSVVSDGEDDIGDGYVYYCEDHTLAHETAHNMGSAHDVDNSDGQGRYPYSYGYKSSASNGNFYTVMSYGDSGQTSYNVFSNPNITLCGGYACGIANQADNARSLGLTIPFVSQFRAAVVPYGRQPAPSDFNGDGISDLVWRNRRSGEDIIWLSANSAVRHPFIAVPNTSWAIVATADFDGDGAADILWRNMASGANTIWRSANSATPLTVSSISDLHWSVAGVGDFDGDGRADILWRNTSTGANSVWRSGNSSTRYTLAAVAGTSWIVAGIGDFDANGKSDILWRNLSTGANTVWYGGDVGNSGALASVANLSWKIVGVGDFNGDGHSDVLWRESKTGQNSIWLSGISTASQTVTRVVDSAWRVAKVGDFDGDGMSDILWRHSSNGTMSLWKSGSSTTEQAITSVSDLSWQIVP